MADKKPPQIRSWEWTDGGPYNRYEAYVDFEAKEIGWVWFGPKDMGGAGTQTYEEFFEKGPMDPDAPPYVLSAVTDAVLATGYRPEAPPAPPSPPPEETLSSTKPRAAGLARPDMMPLRQATDLSDSMTILIGLGVIAASVGFAWLASTIDPVLARYGSLFGSVLLGFAASFRFGRGLLVPAGFFGMAAAIAFLLPYERGREVARGTARHIENAGEIPRAPEATRFTLTNPRVLKGLNGQHEVKSYRNFGSGPREQITVYHVIPLVSPDWQKDQPIPAWISCTTTPGFDCLSRNPSLQGFVRVRESDRAGYLNAIRAAQARYSLKSLPDSAILVANSDPEDAPANAFRLAMLLPTGIAAGWLALSLGYILWRRRQARTKSP
ncbi:MAG: hypothetical protein CFE31_03260 [Rhizobiales bacterium PAR1]|nr:MAG: hypothetical protein CFE31_03260 [Rhizobiales bacterium PAR1]